MYTYCRSARLLQLLTNHTCTLCFCYTLALHPSFLSLQLLFHAVTHVNLCCIILTLQLSDRKRLKINVVMAPNHDVSQYRPDIPSSTLNQYGFAGMVMDCIEAPGPQLAFYCHYHNLHNIPLAHRLSPRQLEMVGSYWG